MEDFFDLGVDGGGSGAGDGKAIDYWMFILLNDELISFQISQFI